ncbi:Thiazole biosynthesis [Shewanella piezotolerans WP3]|uniref:Thiazole synthase n=1 Tax=Shewanella piezotolerans (strain WP3 / JCM 13877) TaxID=225849 RepID=THIG_SHEPW|nr:thiazole synthase [Shewanella piezotolerans]B8CNW1.1 RecName: Full=Thiazole synthase [Shewanella piezotolerans WP3]ACJ29080.1 Thiazole biosynthesis [Shewanella piezotolerans WP3]
MLKIGDTEFTSRLFTGTGKFANDKNMLAAIGASNSELVTLAVKRLDLKTGSDNILKPLQQRRVKLLPNTAGARNVKEAIFAAHLSREMLGTNWIKLEIHPDPKYLMPDPIETLAAARILCEQGYVVLPYVHADPVLCRRLEEVGCAAVMPLGSPIGSNQGLATEPFLKIIIEQSQVPVVIDAGIGAPSQATRAMELGADAVLVNTAIASSADPVAMGRCFAQAVDTGRAAFIAGLGNVSEQANSTSPLTGFLNV